MFQGTGIGIAGMGIWTGISSVGCVSPMVLGNVRSSPGVLLQVTRLGPCNNTVHE